MSIERRDSSPFPDVLTAKLLPFHIRQHNINHRAVPCVWMLVTSGFLETRLIKVSVDQGNDETAATEWSSRFSSSSTRLLRKTQKFESRISPSDAHKLFLTTR